MSWRYRLHRWLHDSPGSPIRFIVVNLAIMVVFGAIPAVIDANIGRDELRWSLTVWFAFIVGARRCWGGRPRSHTSREPLSGRTGVAQRHEHHEAHVEAEHPKAQCQRAVADPSTALRVVVAHVASPMR